MKKHERSSSVTLAIALATAGMLPMMSGCEAINAYKQVGVNNGPDGAYDKIVTQEQQTQADLTNEHAEKRDKLLQIQRENERVNKRMQTQQAESDKADADLKAALESRRITKATYDILKRQQEDIQRELGGVQLKAATDRGKPADMNTIAAKENQLAALKERQTTLQTDMARALGK